MLARFFHRIANGVRRRWRALGCITSSILPQKRVGREISRIIVVEAAQPLRIGWPDQDPFIPLGKYYRDGIFPQPDIFVAEMPKGRLHVGSGLVCTPDNRALLDADLLDRMETFRPFNGPKPRQLTRLRGNYSTLQYCFADNFWHWMLDCLPKVISLERALAGEKLVLLMPDTISATQKETILGVLPENFSAAYYPPETWIEAETFYWPSIVSGRCNGFLPPGYYDTIRERIFARYGLSHPSRPHRRLYLTRADARHRRIENEEELRRLLAEYSFETIDPAHLSFPEQVRLFQEASLVVSPHGAGIAATIFSGPLTLIVFYATQVPPNYFHSQACALGQRHRFLLHHGAHEDSDFTIDLADLRQLLEEEISRAPAAP